MHFDIHAVDIALPLEARAYLELRLFSALSQPGTPVFAVRVEVKGPDGFDGTAAIRCRVRALLRAGGEIAVERRGSHLYTVIDTVAAAAASAVAPAVETVA